MTWKCLKTTAMEKSDGTHSLARQDEAGKTAIVIGGSHWRTKELDWLLGVMNH